MLPGNEHDSDRLDRAIDDVARRMTEGAAPADLKARVLARIEEQDASRWPRRLAWLAAPLAAAAVIFLIVFLRLDHDANRGGENVTQAAPVARTLDRPLPPTPLQETLQPKARTEAARTTDARTSVSTPRSFRTPSDVESMAPPQLQVPSIVVPSLAISDIATTPIAVEPLETIAPITLSPIGEGDRQ